MTKTEYEEISRLPDKYKPLTAWKYFWLSVLFAVPIVGFVFLIIFSISSSNINRRSFARSFFCVYVLAIIVILIMVISGGLAGLFSK